MKGILSGSPEPTETIADGRCLNDSVMNGDSAIQKNSGNDGNGRNRSGCH